MSNPASQISAVISKELGVLGEQVDAVIQLLDGGATVPFIARYRKEQHGALDDGQLRELEKRLSYLREMEERRATILASIDEQGKLTPALKNQILSAETKVQLEDLYLPYKPKRRTKGQIAIEAGLEPLADALYQNPELTPENEATAYIDVDKGFADVKAVLEGAKFILMERFSEDAVIVGQCRDYLWQYGKLKAQVVKDKENEGAKFSDYFDYEESLQKIPSHRLLAVLRGRKEGFLRSSITEGKEETDSSPCEGMLAKHFEVRDNNRPADSWLKEVISWTWKIKLATQLETDLMTMMRLSAEEDAIKVFVSNLNDLLMAAPAGPRVIMGLDPAYRTGVKVVVIDATGKILEHTAIFPHQPQNKWDQSLHVLAVLCQKYKVEIVSIGNGTASRETENLVKDLIKAHKDIKLEKMMVSEAGASVYSASELAAKEFPDLDVTVRGAISIARRLQDPLAELVKVDPKAIGVGQYQHDVNQFKLATSLENVVEDCVNKVGVDINTASAPLLKHVSGLSNRIAENIVSYREENGGFNNRKQLLKISGLGEKAFEQAAGFLKIKGENVLDNSSVHPESYHIVEKIAQMNNCKIETIIGDKTFLSSLNIKDYITDTTGELTIVDIIKELEKPGRDPRPEFKTAAFKDGVEKLTDLELGMILEGVVSNVTNFGAFVDVGVHQDGLVHISALSNSFVKDPRQVVKAGDIVKVKIMELDVPRKRIAMSMRLEDEVGAEKPKRQSPKRQVSEQRRSPAKANKRAAKPTTQAPPSALAQALADALK